MYKSDICYSIHALAALAQKRVEAFCFSHNYTDMFDNLQTIQTGALMMDHDGSSSIRTWNLSSPATLQDYLEFHPQDRVMIFWPDTPPFIWMHLFLLLENM